MDQIDLSKKAAIDRFLADNPELEELSANLATFNVFRALKIEDAEIRHSNVVAWLLNPEGSHGLGDVFLRRLLSNILLQSNMTIEGISAAKVELMNFIDIEIRREWRNIDLLIIDRKNNFVVLIENKVHSGESPGQLKKYMRTIKEEFHSVIEIPIFLTLTGLESADEEAASYISYSYSQLLAVLETIFAQRESQIAEPVAIFIRHYMKTLRRLTMQDESLIDLCKTIYRKHREAIDLVVEYGMVGAGQAATEELLAEEGDYEILHSSPPYVSFLPKSWADIVPENNIVGIPMSRPISVVCWIEFWKEKICLHFELLKMDDPQLRIKCVKKLDEAGYSFSKKAFNENATYSRFYIKNQKITDHTEEKEVRKAVEKLLNKAKPEFPKVEKVLREVFSNQGR